MKEQNPIEILFSNWPSRRVLADEIGANVDAVHKWAASGRIPSGWQADVVATAQRKGLSHVTAQWMLDVHAQARGAA